MNQYKFGAIVNCIDGRAQLPASDWVRFHGGVDYVDTITEPGIVKSLSSGNRRVIEYVREKLEVSVNLHQTEIVAVIGHFDCAANPVEFEAHKKQIEKSAELITGWKFPLRVAGLYVNEWNSVDVIFDSSEDEHQVMNSFL